MAPIAIHVDARCLQDDAYRYRGVGHHAATMLGQARVAFRELGGVTLIGQVDPVMPALNQEHADLFDDISATPSRVTQADWFLSLSPMTHSPVRMAPLFLGGVRRHAAIAYDFIPLEEPQRYLPDPAVKREYMTALRWLGHHDLLICISQFTASRCHEVLGMQGKTCVSGVAVRPELVGPKESPADAMKHFLVVGGGDTRKNAECAVVAHARSELFATQRIPLIVVGGYPPAMADGLRRLHYQNGGKHDLLSFSHALSDKQLSALYRDAILTICPSRKEGFSIPIVEANANGCPVIVANCPAQTELIPFADDQFDPDDHERVTRLMEASTSSVEVRRDIVRRQEGIWTRFSESEVGARFWRPILEQTSDRPNRKTDVRTPAILRQVKPRIAVVSPMPPDRSGVADYTAACLGPLSELADVHVFTDTANPMAPDSCKSVAPLSPLPYLASDFDAVVSVIGNSHLHIRPLQYLLDYGGAAIAHDARMINFYAVLKGAAKATAIASKEMKRVVEWPEVERWLLNQRHLPTLFLSEILDAATPTIVHSKITKTIIADQYGKDVCYLPFSVYRDMSDDLPRSFLKQAARERLGIDPSVFLVSTFGLTSPDKAPESCVWALYLLTAWGINAKLAFVGESAGMSGTLKSLAIDLRIMDRLIMFNANVDEAVYRDFMNASDAGIQLRTYALGGLSGGALDCIAAGLPTVVTSDLGEAMDAPEFVVRVPNGISPVLIAEKLFDIAMSPRDEPSRLAARNAYLTEHNFTHYTRQLLHVLGLGA
jgi:glycosyltransferase involved in cell wall biosynthesis